MVGIIVDDVIGIESVKVKTYSFGNAVSGIFIDFLVKLLIV